MLHGSLMFTIRISISNLYTYIVYNFSMLTWGSLTSIDMIIKKLNIVYDVLHTMPYHTFYFLHSLYMYLLSTSLLCKVEVYIHSLKMNTLHIYNGIYYAWELNTFFSQCKKWNWTMWKNVKLYLLGSMFRKNNQIMSKDFADLRSYIFNTKGGN